MKLGHLLLGLGLVVITTLILTLQIQRPELESIPAETFSNTELLIIPHHDIAKPLAILGINEVKNDPELIFLLSPNHFELGSCDIISKEATENLPDHCQGEHFFQTEHGVNNLVPILKDAFPAATILPFIFKKNTPATSLNVFLEYLQQTTLSKPTLIVGSIDFSHYLSEQAADLKDQEISSLIAAKDPEKIKNLGPDYLDSPPVLYLIIKLSNIFGSSLNQIARGNSADFVGQSSDTTSYLVYSSNSPETRQEDISRINILAVGDIMLGRSVNTTIQKQKDFSFPAQKIFSKLPESDLFLANLESPFADNCPLTDTGMVFCADLRSVATLKTLGVTVATIANNHIGNQGQSGLVKTMEILDQNGIKPISSSQIINIKGARLALIAFNDIPPYTAGINKLLEDTLIGQIKEVKTKSDIVIVTPHWGNEYQLASSRQKTLAHLAIDSGADLVIGHHPHWVQEVEEYKGKLIYYSLGNFVFDQMWSEKTRQGIIANITIENGKIISHQELPVLINKNYQPELQR